MTIDPATNRPQPNIEDYATIEAWCDGQPVYSFGNILYVYGISPDLQPGAVMQIGNTHPRHKIKPKKSWEISYNLCGANPGPSDPKLPWNDDQPCLPIHLIDGDPGTIWASHGSRVPDERAEWIRIDLPAETTINAVALVCPREAPPADFLGRPGPNAGKQLPENLAIQVSRDAWHWQTVYQNEHFEGDDAGATVISFEPIIAKQVLIRATRLRRMEGHWSWGYVFSIGGVEVRDAHGTNLALVSRGAGVAVSSTSHILAHDRITLDQLYVPIHSDLGYKWVRLGGDNGPLLWRYVEREKGKLQVDPRVDDVITELNRNGMHVILCLDIKGNWVYKDPPQRTDWRWARVHDLLNTYHNHPGWVTDTAAQLEGYLHFVEYMVSHFKGRVAYWELGNESPQVRDLVRKQIAVIRRVDPDTPLMLGSPGGLRTDEILGALVDGLEGAEVRHGALTMWGTGMTTAVVESTNEQDITVSVDVRADMQAGIIIRARDAGNYLQACYEPMVTPNTGRLFYRERVNGVWSGDIAVVPLRDLHPDQPESMPYAWSGQDLRPLDPFRQLTVQARGSHIQCTVSDGDRTLTTQYVTDIPVVAGMAGLSHSGSHKQTYNHFEARAAGDAILFTDSFNGSTGAATGWRLLEGHWRDTDSQPALAQQINAIGWHVYFDQSRPVCWQAYRRFVDQFRRDCEELGFHGEYMITEMYHGDVPAAASSGQLAPDYGFGVAPVNGVSEMQMAKEVARNMLYHNGMNIGALYCNTTASDRWTGQTLVRVTAPVDTVNPVEPKPAYYALRTISTLLDGFHAAELPLHFSAAQPIDWVTFRHANGEWLIAAWVAGVVTDSIAEVRCDITLPSVIVAQAWAIDTMNGTGQELSVSVADEGTLLRDMLIKDYPVCVRLSIRS